MIKAVLFDIDGVLLDSLEANAEWYKRLVEKFGYRGPTVEEYKKIYHFNLRDSLKSITKEKDSEKIQKMWEYGSKLLNYPNELLRIPKGEKETIKKLKNKYKLAIVTSRVESGVEGFYDFSHLRKYFDTDVHFGDYTNPKPDPECLFVGLKRLNISPSEAVYVGDAKTDMLAAKRAGMNFILYPKNPLIKAKHKLENFSDLPFVLERWFNR